MCRNCEGLFEPLELSDTKLCPECGQAILEANVRGLAAHEGYPFERWRRAMAASVGGVLLDDVLPSD